MPEPRVNAISLRKYFHSNMRREGGSREHHVNLRGSSINLEGRTKNASNRSIERHHPLAKSLILDFEEGPETERADNLSVNRRLEPSGTGLVYRASKKHNRLFESIDASRSKFNLSQEAHH